MIAQGQCTIFKQNLLNGLENFSATSPYFYQIALYTSNASLGSSTLAYTPIGEVSGTGYSAGGAPILPTPAVLSGTTAYISFSNITWPSASFVARGALIYNYTTKAAVAVLDFGADKTAKLGTPFTITFPPDTATTALIRIS